MVQSIDRAMQIIHLLVSEQNGHFSISEIAKKSGLPLSTVHRLLQSLLKYELVAQIPETKKYKIGNKWMEIGLGILENLDFRAVAKPFMEHLAHEVQESIYLNIPNGIYSIIIERVDSPLKVRIIDNLGERIPLTVGAANKTMLANMSTYHRLQILDQLVVNEPDRSQILEQLAKIKKLGYAISYGEKTEGTASVAAPIIGFNQEVIGALSIGVLSYKITEVRLAYLVKQVKEVANKISNRIGKTN